jgi:hypothetical protein
MRKRITFPRFIIAFALLTAVSRKDTAPLVDLIAFPLAMSLFVVAPLSILGALIAPFAAGALAWLYVRHRRGRPLPAPVKAAFTSCSAKALRRPWLARLVASAKAARAGARTGWREPVTATDQPEAEHAAAEHAAGADDTAERDTVEQPDPSAVEASRPAHD